MKLLLTVVGILAIVVGAIWCLQGVGILPGSFMTGQIQWAIYGAVVVIVGLGVLVWARRRPG